MREPSYAWMISARPSACCDVAPVSTTTVPLAAPDDDDVYAIDVHGSDVTAPV